MARPNANEANGRAEENPHFDPHHIHEKLPNPGDLNDLERQGEKIYQQNCAYCHAQDGTGRNWIGSFLEPNATDLTSTRLSSYNKSKLVAVIADGINETSMPAWKHVLTAAEIDAATAYIHRVFLRPTGAHTGSR